MKKQILYVEDNVDTSSAVKFLLDHEGYETTTACCGKDGLRIASEKKFNLILLDIMLPDMSGWDIFEKLHKTNKAKYAFLSALPVSSERMQELKKAGVSDYITKPFTKKELLDRVNKMMG
jgi:DNA-binding response OmpR family regulator